MPLYYRGSPEVTLGLRWFTAQFADKTPHNQIPSTTSAANLPTAFLQSVLFNIHRGYDLLGQRWTGKVVERGDQPLRPLVRGPDMVKNEGLTKSELEQGRVNWANLQG